MAKTVRVRVVRVQPVTDGAGNLMREEATLHVLQDWGALEEGQQLTILVPEPPAPQG